LKGLVNVDKDGCIMEMSSSVALVGVFLS
jgi:hypothetical protein